MNILLISINSDLVVLINKIHNYLYHHVLFFSPTLCNHQREGNEGIVRQSFAAIGAIENAIVVEEPKEQCGSNAFVAVTERMVFVTR